MDENNKQKYVSAHGRRKGATARVRLFKGKGEVIVNGKPFSEYFPGGVALAKLGKFLSVSKVAGDFSATIKVTGSGKQSQLGSVLHGLARAIASHSAETKPVLRKAGYITRDPRVRERRKFGLAQKARAGKQSPKR